MLITVSRILTACFYRWLTAGVLSGRQTCFKGFHKLCEAKVGKLLCLPGVDRMTWLHAPLILKSLLILDVAVYDSADLENDEDPSPLRW